MKFVIDRVSFGGHYSWTLYARNSRKIAESGRFYDGYRSCYKAARRIKKLLEPNYSEIKRGVK